VSIDKSWDVARWVMRFGWRVIEGGLWLVITEEEGVWLGKLRNLSCLT
jgi:hypothetical protein